MSRPKDPIREAWMQRYNISSSHPERTLPRQFLAQLSKSKSEEARRLIVKRVKHRSKFTATPPHLRKKSLRTREPFPAMRGERLAMQVAQMTERITGDPCEIQQTSERVYIILRREPGGRIVRA